MRQPKLIFVHRVRLSRGFCCRCALTAGLPLLCNPTLHVVIKELRLSLLASCILIRHRNVMWLVNLREVVPSSFLKQSKAFSFDYTNLFDECR